MISACDLLSAGICKFLQSDGGHLGQEVQLLSFYDSNKDKIVQIWVGLKYTGKKSEEVALEMNYSLALFCPGGKIDGSTSNSGQGTPKSFGEACKILKLYCVHAMDHSCGLHDCQSVIHLAIQYCIGVGGFDNENAIQFLHTLYSMFLQNKSYWLELTTKFYRQIEGDNVIQKDLRTAMQEPLITR